MKPRERAFELDLLRGFAITMMMLHHLAYDLRYVFDLPIFAFQDQLWFIDWVRAPFVMIFLGVSGICGTFTRSNAKRGLKLAGVALLFTVVTAVASVVTGQDLYILFNVLHLLAVGTLLYALFEKVERNRFADAAPTRGGDAILLILASFLLWAGEPLARAVLSPSLLLLPLGRPDAFLSGMADYMPIIPWLGFFLIGTVIGRTLYITRTTAFPGAARNPVIQRTTAPVRFVGRHALAVYVLHQPVLLAILYLMRAVGIF